MNKKLHTKNKSYELLKSSIGCVFQQGREQYARAFLLAREVFPVYLPPSILVLIGPLFQPSL